MVDEANGVDIIVNIVQVPCSSDGACVKTGGYFVREPSTHDSLLHALFLDPFYATTLKKYLISR